MLGISHPPIINDRSQSLKGAHVQIVVFKNYNFLKLQFSNFLNHQAKQIGHRQGLCIFNLYVVRTLLYRYRNILLIYYFSLRLTEVMEHKKGINDIWEVIHIYLHCSTVLQTWPSITRKHIQLPFWIGTTSNHNTALEGLLHHFHNVRH